YRNSIIDFLNEFSIKPQYINDLLESKETSPLRQTVKLVDVLLRPQVSIFDLEEHVSPFNKHLSFLPENRRKEVLESAEITVKYEGYISRERQLAEKLVRLENINIESKFDYHKILSI